MTFERKITQFINQHQLLNEKANVIVGISGGADSVVLLYLLNKLGYKCIAAHCNFTLRGNESKADEQFVERFAQQLGCEFRHTTFNTKEIAQNTNRSIEMTARDLRYEWFEQQRVETGSNTIAVAHHANDLAETLLLNITRGTGHKGLTSMQPQRGNIIRPLLCVTREEIESYAKEQGLTFRTDSTNADTEIQRNRIRHNVIPQLEAINPSFVQTMSSNHKVWCNTEQLVQWSINHWREVITIESNDQRHHFSIEVLLSSPAPESILFEILRDYGFNATVCSQLYRSLKETSGTTFYSSTHEAIIDRNEIIVARQTFDKQKDDEITIDSDLKNLPEWLNLETGIVSKSFRIKRDKNCATFDAQSIHWPLTLRHWREGDTMEPFGMHGMQKVSDLLINNKIDCQTKHTLWILADMERILWIVGLRADGRGAITNATQRYVEFSLKQ